jgi:hypothetical protein
MNSPFVTPRFNLETMSGVFPGTRTQLFQRVQLRALDGERWAWGVLYWDEAPRACALHLVEGDAAPTVTPEPLFRLAPLWEEFNLQLHNALRLAGWQLVACGSCAHWQPVATTTPDQLASGQCGWQLDGEPAKTPVVLTLQSLLALNCPHWTSASSPAILSTARPVEQTAPVRKVAEVSESKLPFAVRLWRRLQRWIHPRARTTNWEANLLERSGVGAGTEPCFVCQGRIANLGALTVETPEGDKQTFSVWRCRNCYTIYLNDWIDRWERLDNLETEERYHRVAPAEARELLHLIYGVAGGEHPSGRRERVAERNKLLHFITGRTPLSHQVRQGR